MFSVVKERSTLVHQMQISFNPNSALSRPILARQLGERLDCVLPEYQFLSSLMAGIKESLEVAECQFDLNVRVALTAGFPCRLFAS